MVLGATLFCLLWHFFLHILLFFFFNLFNLFNLFYAQNEKAHFCLFAGETVYFLYVRNTHIYIREAVRAQNPARHACRVD